MVWSVVFITCSALSQTSINKNQLPEIGVVASEVLTIDKEILIGDAVMRQLRGQAPMLLDPVMDEYIQDLGNRLVVEANNTKFPFVFFIINNPSINAFAFYGGHIGIHTGLLFDAENESELASVLAHEIAHVTQRHIARRAQAQSRAAPLQLASLIGGILVAMADPSSGVAAIQASSALGAQSTINYTRKNEQEADNIGIAILARAGFDPNGAVSFFSKLAEQSRGSSLQLSFLRTHPLAQSRISEARSRAANYPTRVLPDNLSFHLAKVRVLARNAGSKERNIAVFTEQTTKLTGVRLDAANYGLALSYMQTEANEEAHKIMKELLKSSPENLFYLDAMTDILIEQGKANEAVKLLYSHWQRKPQNSVLTLNLANAYISLGNNSSAIQILRDFLLVKPNYFLAYSLLSDAYSKSQMKKEMHTTNAERYALAGVYPLAIDELQFAYNYTGDNGLEKQRLRARIEQFREAQERLTRL